MAPSDSDNNIKSQFDKYKQEQRDKEKKLSETKEKGQLSKYLVVLHEINSTLKEMLEENIYSAREIIEQQGKMTKSLSAIENGIKDLNHTLVSAITNRPASSTASDIFEELNDQSMFSDDPYDDGEFVAMSENMADMLTDYYDSSMENAKQTTKAVDSMTDAITRVVDDLEDFTDELSAPANSDAEDGFFSDGPELMSDIGGVLEDTNSYWATAISIFKGIDDNIDSIASYISRVRQLAVNDKNKKLGTTGKTDVKKEKGIGFADALAGLGIATLLKKYLNPINLVKMLGKGILGALKGFFITIPTMIAKTMFKVTGWISKKLGSMLTTVLANVKKMPFVQGVTNGISKFFKNFTASISKFFAPITSRISKFFAPLTKFLAPLMKFNSKFLGGPVMKFFSKLMGGISKHGIKAVPFIGQIWMVVDTLWDFAKGFSGKGASEITGKAEDTLNIWDKFKSGIASAISGFLFGLVDSKKVYNYIDSISGRVYDAMTEAFDMLPDSWKKFGKKVLSYFDLSNKDSLLSKSVEYIKDFSSSVVPYIEGAWSTVKGIFTEAYNMIPTSFRELFDRVGTFLSDTIFSKSFYVKVWDSITDVSAKIYDSIANSNLLNTFVEKVQNVQSEIYSAITERVKNFLNSIVDLVPTSIKNFISSSASFMADKAKKAYNYLSGENEKKASYNESRLYSSVVKELSGIKKELKATPQERAQVASRVHVVPQAVNTRTSSIMDKQMSDRKADKKMKASNTNNNVVVNNGGANRTSASRNINSGRSDISRSIGRGSQFSFGG